MTTPKFFTTVTLLFLGQGLLAPSTGLADCRAGVSAAVTDPFAEVGTERSSRVSPSPKSSRARSIEALGKAIALQFFDSQKVDTRALLILVEMAPAYRLERLGRQSAESIAAASALDRLAGLSGFPEAAALALLKVRTSAPKRAHDETGDALLARAMMYLKPESAELGKHLARLMKEGSPGVRLAAIRALKETTLEHRTALLPEQFDGIIATLGFPVFVRGIAATPSPSDRVPTLAAVKVELLQTLLLFRAYNQSSSPLYRRDFSLGADDEKRLEEAAVHLLAPAEEGAETTIAALGLLRAMAPAHRSTARAIARLTTYPNSRVRLAAADALGAVKTFDHNHIAKLQLLVQRGASLSEIASAEAAISSLSQNPHWYDRLFFWK